MNTKQPDDGGTSPSQNLSLEEFISRRTEALSEQPEAEMPLSEPEEEAPEPPEEVDETAEVEELEAEPGESEEEPDAEEEADDAESEIDLLSLTPEQIQELAKKGKSRLLHRIGELTAQKRALEAKLQETQETNPVPQVPEAENPFRALKSVDEIQAKWTELEGTVEVTDRLLEDHEDYGPDDIIEVDGKEFTKRQIRQANRNARQALIKYLPAQAQTLKQRERLTVMEQEYEKAIPLEIPEVQDEEGEVSKVFKSLKEDPLIARLRKEIPELAPQINYILAHASNSIIASKKKPKLNVKATGFTGKAKVPAVPGGAVAGRSAIAPKKKESEAYQRFQQTGSVEDWIAARAAKLSTT
jgi:hypothetical protein